MKRYILLALMLWAKYIEACWESNQASHQPSDLRSNQTNIQFLAWGLQDRARLEEILEQLLIIRSPGSDGSSIVRAALRSRLLSLGWTVETHTFTAVSPLGEKVEMTNLVASQSPKSPRQLLIGCHIDSKRTPLGFLGATDSAVPCALLLDLAESLGTLERSQEELGLSLVFLDGEEQLHEDTLFGPDGLYGSKEMSTKLANTEYWVGDGPWCQSAPSTEMARIDLLLLLDLIGGPSPSFWNVIVNLETGACDELFSELSYIEDNLYRLCPDCLPGPRFFYDSCTGEDDIVDDHLPFLENGLRRALHVIADPFPEVWHTMEDDRSHLDWEAIERVASILRVFVAEYLHVIL